MARTCRIDPTSSNRCAAGKSLKAPDGRAVLTYLTSKPEGSNLRANSACCFHPVTTPSGERLTDLAPGDHVHHRGIFLAWHSIDFRRKADFSKMGPTRPTHGFDIARADFWGWGEFAPTDQRVIRNRDVQLVKATDTTAELAIRNDWTIRNNRYVDEQTTAVWRARDGANILDLTYGLTPDWDMTLNQTPFGGFCVRARNDGESWYEGPSGKIALSRSPLLGGGSELAGRGLVRLRDHAVERQDDRLCGRGSSVQPARDVAQSALRLDGQPVHRLREAGDGAERPAADAPLPRDPVRREVPVPLVRDLRGFRRS